jgi:hypothetical protein
LKRDGSYHGEDVAVHLLKDVLGSGWGGERLKGGDFHQEVVTGGHVGEEVPLFGLGELRVAQSELGDLGLLVVHHVVGVLDGEVDAVHTFLHRGWRHVKRMQNVSRMHQKCKGGIKFVYKMYTKHTTMYIKVC